MYIHLNIFECKIIERQCYQLMSNLQLIGQIEQDMRRDQQENYPPSQLLVKKQEQDRVNEDFGIDDINKNNSNKKITLTDQFLKSISEADLQKIYSFLESNTYEVKRKSAVSLYEDIFMICHFKVNQQYILDNPKKKQALITMIAFKLERSEHTIKDRMTKMLCKVPIQTILTHLESKKDFRFDCHRNYINPDREPKTEQKSKFKKNNLSQHHDKIISNLRFVSLNRNNFPNSQIGYQDTNTAWINDKEEQVSQNNCINESVYKYGSKPVKDNLIIRIDKTKSKIECYTKKNFQKIANSKTKIKSTMIDYDALSQSKKTNEASRQMKICDYDKILMNVKRQLKNINFQAGQNSLKQEVQQSLQLCQKPNKIRLTPASTSQSIQNEEIDEDNLLYNFKISRLSFEHDIRELMKRKSIQYILEKMKNLGDDDDELIDMRAYLERINQKQSLKNLNSQRLDD